MAELAQQYEQQYEVHPNQITDWKARLTEGAAGPCDVSVLGAEPAPAVDLKLPHAMIGELALENDSLPGALSKAVAAERKAMIDREYGLPLGSQAELLKLSRSPIYYELQPVPPGELATMRQIDELHLNYPFAGSHMLRDLLQADGVVIGRDNVATLMRRMGIEVIYRRLNTSKPAVGHKIYPYLVRDMKIDRPNQVWAMGINYIPMSRGFVYLAAVVGWFTRRVLSWRLSVAMEAEFCLEAVAEALAKYGKLEFFNTDQGSQFTSAAFTGLLLENQIVISMDGRGSWRDNVFVERLWRSVKYQEAYLRAYDRVAHAQSYLVRYLTFYNARRPHSNLGARTPDHAYFNHFPLLAAA